MSLITSLFPKKIKTFFKKLRKFNALNNLDKKLINYLDYMNGYFIECGANDGVDQSNTWYFDKHLKWSGILIEPHPLKFKELIKNRDKKNIFINSALIGNEYNKDKISLVDNDMHSSISNSNSNDDKKKILVKAVTLTEILKENKSPNLIDLFSLDVEGYEFEVLNGIDFNLFNFKYILIETKNNEVINFLKNKNYIYIKKLSYHDHLLKFNSELI
jgi:FkbM family methyltransferase